MNEQRGKGFFKYGFLICLAWFLSGCGSEPQQRRYTEIVSRDGDDSQTKERALLPKDGDIAQMPQMQKILSGSVVDMPLSWSVPDGWIALPAEGMRAVTFKSENLDAVIECSIIILHAKSGSVKDNVLRWAGQIDIQVAEEQLKEFIDQQKTLSTAEGWLAGVFDFTRLQKDENSDKPSMMAAIVQLPQAGVYIKMTGSKSAIIANQKPFEQLVLSLKAR